MQPPDRLHGLDAVRALALISGVALHAAMPYVAGLPRLMSVETPNDILAGVWYTIHIFRMPLFFLIAGYFGRLLLERRGVPNFIRDRAKRILLPLIVGLPIVMLLTGLASVLGALAAGADLQSVQPPKAPPSSNGQSLLASIPLIHLWFLYYLIIFYLGALILRRAFGRFTGALDASVRCLMRGVWGPLVLALPLAAYYIQLPGWSVWGGLPAPFSIIPDPGALLAYGMFFGFGWVLQRQQPLLFALAKRWPLYCVLAVVSWALCRAIAGSAPHWGPFLKDGQLVAYTLSFMVSAWCWTFGLIGLAMRTLSGFSPVRRYLADSSYWIYLMHIPALMFFDQVLHPLPLHWSVRYSLSIASVMIVTLVSYHYLVRHSFLGATLNGRRQARTRRHAEPASRVERHSMQS